MVSSPVSMKPRNDATVPQSAAPGISVRVVVLLAVAAFINYVDRGNLATAGPLIRDELALSNAQLGVLLSAFFWSYAPAQLLAGWLAERRDARVVLAAGLAVWGGATVLTGIASGFVTLLLLRLALGWARGSCIPRALNYLLGMAWMSSAAALTGCWRRDNPWALPLVL